MCRLYAFRANELTKVECTLAYAQNALLNQSRADLTGKDHSDGWGIAVYENGLPKVERQAIAAHEGLHFSRAAERIYATTVVAHVRRATVGRLSVDNTHPFTGLGWVFAHNGTVRGFDQVGPRLAAETPERFLTMRRGDTDSELAFLWLLGRMAAAGLDPDSPGTGATELAEVVADSVRTLAGRCAAAAPEKEARLNFVLSDGRILVASRWRHTLHMLLRERVRDCEICGIPHVRHDEGLDYRALVIASEPISHEAWSEVPDQSVVAVGPGIEPRIQPILQTAR